VEGPRFHPPVVVLVGYVDAECPERLDHELRITGPQRATNQGFAIGECSQHERPIGDRL
jgi:hypothetical protein